MSIIATRNVISVTITASRDGNSIKLQPILNKNGEGFNGIVNGGTL